MTELSEDHLLGGRVRLLQPREGYRAGLDAVLLAASIPAKSGESVLDLGTGAGAAGLCLMARVPGLALTGVERDEEMAGLAHRNAALNRAQESFAVVTEDIAGRKLLSSQAFDHVMANPPFHEPHRHRQPKLAQRARSLVEGEVGLDQWLAVALRRVKPGGSLTFILRADRLAAALGEIEGRAGAIRLLAIHSRADEPAIRVIIQAIKERRTPLTLLPPLILFAKDQTQSREALAVLQDAHALPLGEP